eukprot:superscaffoldBa00000482_g5077
MTASLQDSILLFLLLFLLTVFTQSSAVQTTPTPWLFDPLTQPECTKKEHPKVSIQGLQMSRLAQAPPVLHFKGVPIENGSHGRELQGRWPVKALCGGSRIEKACTMKVAQSVDFYFLPPWRERLLPAHP